MHDCVHELQVHIGRSEDLHLLQPQGLKPAIIALELEHVVVLYRHELFVLWSPRARTRLRVGGRRAVDPLDEADQLLYRAPLVLQNHKRRRAGCFYLLETLEDGHLVVAQGQLHRGDLLDGHWIEEPFQVLKIDTVDEPLSENHVSLNLDSVIPLFLLGVHRRLEEVYDFFEELGPIVRIELGIMTLNLSHDHLMINILVPYVSLFFLLHLICKLLDIQAATSKG